MTNAAPANLTRDFGYRGAGIVGDTVFLDVNNNGVADPGEGIASITVTLTGDHDADGVDETVTTTTNAGGAYQFSGLRTASTGVLYTVAVVNGTLPGGLDQSLDPDGVRDHRAATTLTNAAASDLTRDFGYRGPGAVGDTVFLDVNNNGQADSGEGISNVTVSLTGDLDGDGSDETAVATTDANGQYQFSGLRITAVIVTYRVTVASAILPSGLAQSFDPDRTLDHRALASLSSIASSNLTRDFGYRGLGSIGDTIFADINNNNAADPGEGLLGVSVSLTGDLDGDGVDETVTTTTDTNGLYAFSGLRTSAAGVIYTVIVHGATVPAGLTQSFDPDGTRDNRATTTLTNAAPTDATRDFGYRGPGSIGDTVFLDVNNNGQADAGEGIANVMFTLTGCLDGSG